LTKASLYVYFGCVDVLVCRRFDHTPLTTGNRTTHALGTTVIHTNYYVIF